MSALFGFIVKIAALFIIFSLCECIVSGSKNAKYVKSIVSVLIIISVIEFVSSIDLSKIIIDIDSYSVDNTQMWDNTIDYVSTEIENELLSLCKDNSIFVDSIKVTLKSDYESIEIKEIRIQGIDAVKCKNYLSSYLNLNDAYIVIGD